MAEKPDCYDCRFRDDIPGDAHSCCKHPDAPPITGLGQIVQILGSRSGAGPGFTTRMDVVFHPTGVRKGWAAWPWNFDPVWLLKCSGFTRKEDTTA